LTDKLMVRKKAKKKLFGITLHAFILRSKFMFSFSP